MNQYQDARQGLAHENEVAVFDRVRLQIGSRG